MKRISLRISQTFLVCGALAIGLAGCKKGEEAPAEDTGGGEQQAAAKPEPPKPPPVTDVKLAKKWPDGQAATFIKSVKFNRATAAGTNSQERTTTYSMNFGGGPPADGATMDAGGGAGAATLAKSFDLRIVGQKFEIGLNGKPMIAFSGQAAGGGDGGDEMMDNPDAAGDAGGGAGAPPPNPVAKAVEKSLGGAVKLTYDAAGKISKVDALQPLQTKILTGAPRGVWPMIGGMFSESVFKEAPQFHSLLNGTDVKKDGNWIHREKGMLLLNWQQDFTFTNTFTGMEEWNGRKVAVFNITGAISGKTDRPVKSEIAPGGSFTGKALYAPDLGILVQRTINGNFDATETGQPAKYSFTQEFKVSQLGAGGGDDM